VIAVKGEENEAGDTITGKKKEKTHLHLCFIGAPAKVEINKSERSNVATIVYRRQ